MTRLAKVSWGAVLALALSAGFVVQTTLVNRLPAALAASAAVVPAALALVLVSYRLPAGERPERAERVLAAAVGLGIWLTPFMVAAVRHTDAPAGTEVLFLTSAVWGLLLVLGGLLPSPLPLAVTRAAVALLGMTGAIGILGNWERPSSFSPFVRFRTEELTMLLAGVVWVATVAGLAELVRRRGSLGAARAVALPAALAGTLGALLLAPARLGELLGPDVLPLVVLSALAAFAVLLSWTELLREVPSRTIAAAYFLPPVLLTGLSGIERLTVTYGPNPIVWSAAIAGMAVACTGAFLVAIDLGSFTPPGEGLLGPLLPRTLAVLSLVLGVVGLAATDLVVSVHGSLSSGPAFSTTYGMSGFETVGGWLAACCGVLVVAWTWLPHTRGSRRSLLVLAALLVAAAAWAPVHSTPTHAWNTWIPFDVQQDYGTEYASKSVRDVTGAWQPAAIAAAVAAGALSSLKRRASAEAAREGQEVSQG